MRYFAPFALALLLLSASDVRAQILPPPPPQAVPEIVVQSADGSVEIVSGDATPASADGTLFDAVAVASGTTTRTFRIRNAGGKVLTLGANAVSAGGDFTISTQPPSTVPVNDFATFVVTFDPTAGGTRTATVSIANDDADENPYTFAISGEGLVPDIEVRGNGIAIPVGDTTPSAADDTDFGDVEIGQASSRTFTVANTGGADLTFSVSDAGANAGDFVLATPDGTTVTPAGSARLVVTATPSASGARIATITVTSNDPDESPYTFRVRATGTSSDLSVTLVDALLVDGNSNGLVEVGETIRYTAVVTNSGSAAASGATFTVTPDANTSLIVGSTTTTQGAVTSGNTAGDASSTVSIGAVAASGGSATITFDVTVDDAGQTQISTQGTLSGDNFANVLSDDPAAGGATNPTLTTISQPEVNVQGSGFDIADGDATPRAADGTDFGRVVTASANQTRTFAIQNTGVGRLDLGTPAISITGAQAGDFSVSTQPATTVDGSTQTSFVLTFTPSGDGVRQATVTIASNDFDERAYTFVVQGTGYTPGFSLVESGGATQVTESGTTDDISVVLTAQPESDVVFSVSASDPTEATASPATLTFTAANWNTPQTVTVTGVDDALADGNVTSTVTVAVDAAQSSDPFDGLAAQTATVTTLDNEGALTISIADLSVSESAATATATIALSSPSAAAITVDVATVDGTATAGADYQALAAGFQVTIPAGQTTAPVAIQLISDALDEADETFTLSLSNPTSGTLSDGTATVTIQDDDAEPSLSIAAATAAEGASATVTVTLGAASGKPVTVDYATSDGTATSGADYTAANGTLTFAPGTTTQTFTVALLDDALIEGDETLTVTLLGATNASLATSSAPVTITDTDGALTISAADVLAGEGTGSATVTISLNSATGSAVTVDYATAFGTATSADFTAASGTATIRCGPDEHDGPDQPDRRRAR